MTDSALPPISQDDLHSLFPGESEMARLIREKDWTQTPLGDPRTWEDCLLNAINILLGSRYPMEIWWGPQYLRFYNDSYRPLLGPDRHPHFLGRPGQECWAELWHEIGPMLDGVMHTGIPTYSEDSLLLMTRKGFTEETYVSWSYGPIRARTGEIRGIFCACDETTKKVLSRRRLATLNDLGLGVKDTTNVALAAVEVIARNPHDIPFALIYQGDTNFETVHLLGRTGLDDPRFSAEHFDVKADDAPWPLQQMCDERGPLVISVAPQPETSSENPHRDQKAALFRVNNDGGESSAVVILGVSKRLELDEEYMDFLRLVARHIGSTLDAALARRRLEQEKTRLTDAFMRSPAFMCLTRGPDHVYDFANEQYSRLVGHREVLGKPVAVALPEVVEQGFVDLLDKVYRTGEPYVGRDTHVMLQKTSGGQPEEVVLDFVYQAISEADGTVSGILTHGIDITEQRRSEKDREKLLLREKAARTEAERTSRMKDEFLATLSHELRTPLNAILGWSNILRIGKSQGEELAAGLETIERNARAQTQIIEDLLDMSRIISGKVRLDVQRFDLAEVLRESIHTVQAAAEAKGIRIQHVLDPLPGPILGDPNRLQQVFWNLLNNAIKFTDRGGRVQVLLERVNSHLEISVIDTGQGIRPDFLPHVFDRFQQADSSSTRRFGGLGLGLAIVKQLVELHGGSVRAKSAGDGHGATFIVALPVTAIHSDSDAHADRRHPKTGSTTVEYGPLSLEGLNVLAIDDEPDARALVKRVLEQSFAKVTTAASAEEGLTLVKEQPFAVIVCDIGMPHTDGFGFIGRLRELSGPAGVIPAVALTAYARSGDRTKALRSGFQMHIAKPVEPGELVAVVASLGGRPRKLQ